MKKIILTLILLCVSFYVKSQNQNSAFEDKIIKVKLVKSISYEACDKKDLKKYGVVLEFDVLHPEDKKIFGEKIYAATTCYDFPGDATFYRNNDWDLQLYKNKYYQWEISILNEALLDKNIGGTKYWIKNLSRKINVYSGPKKE